MNGKGITYTLVIIGVLALFGLLTYASNKFGWANRELLQPIPGITALPTATPTAIPAPISNTADIEQLKKELDATTTELDSLQKELDSLDSTLSTKDADALGKELDSVK